MQEHGLILRPARIDESYDFEAGDCRGGVVQYIKVVHRFSRRGYEFYCGPATWDRTKLGSGQRVKAPVKATFFGFGIHQATVDKYSLRRLGAGRSQQLETLLSNHLAQLLASTHVVHAGH